VIKSRRRRWDRTHSTEGGRGERCIQGFGVGNLRYRDGTGHVAHMGGERCIQSFGAGNLRYRDHLETPSICGRTILKWIFGSGMGWNGLD
jgi:hypothetical protein